MLNVFFIFWNSFSWVSVHLKTAFCFVSSRRFAVAAARSGMKVPFDLIMQRNDRSSSLDVGLPASCTVWTLFGSSFIPFLLTWVTKDAFAGADC